MLDYINEAFQKLDLITEDVFDTTPSGIQSMSSFFDNDVADIRVIDKDAADDAELADSYIGKIIVNCNVCHSHIFENKDDITIDTEGIVNVDASCPYCGESEGFTIVGEIAPYSTTETASVDETSDEPADTADIVEDEVELQESVNSVVTDNEKLNEVSTASRKFKPHTIRLLKLIGSDLVSDLEPTELTEDFKEVSITTEDQHLAMTSDENGKVTVTTEPISTPEVSGEEMIAPLSDEAQTDLIASATSESDLSDEDELSEFDEFSEEDVELDEVDEAGFDELGESYLKRVYENVASFRTTNVLADDYKMIVEGKITFNSGVVKPTKFVFESASMSTSGKVQFDGYNKHLTESKNAFSLVGKVRASKLIPESLKYNYTANGTNPVRGIVRRK